MVRSFPVLLALLFCAPPVEAATAEIDLPALESCGRAKPEESILCISKALEPCEAVVPETPAVAVLCYENARRDLEKGLQPALEAVTETEGDAVGAEARIVVRYEILVRNLGCERNAELSELEGMSAADISRQKARCLAMTLGDTWMRIRMITKP